MKKLIALLLTLSICLLCGCSGSNETPTTAAPTTEAPTAAPTTEAPTEAPTTEAPTEPPVVYTNPLTGETLDAPITTRPLAVSLSNIQSALPHVGVVDADIFFESFVNGTIVRGLALYADATDVEAIGSTRSARPILTQLAYHYNAFYAHAGGSDHANRFLSNLGVDNMNVDTWDDSGYSFRDTPRSKDLGWEHCLMVRGAEMLNHAATEKGVDMAQDPEHSFGLTFAEDGTPTDGEAASTVTITLKYGSSTKETVMKYNESMGEYEFNQYGMTMHDGTTGEVESFQNVIVMFADMYMDSSYHYANFEKGGEGYYACGGKIIPIQWKCEGADQPFTYYTMDGEPLAMGIGSSYIAITVADAPVSFE